MNVGELINELKTFDPESRIVIDDKLNFCLEIEEVCREIDVDCNDGESPIIAVIYPRLYKYSIKITDEYPAGYQIKIDLPEKGCFEFRSELGMDLASYKEGEYTYWIALPEEDIEYIRVYQK